VQSGLQLRNEADEKRRESETKRLADIKQSGRFSSFNVIEEDEGSSEGKIIEDSTDKVCCNMVPQICQHKRCCNMVSQICQHKRSFFGIFSTAGITCLDFVTDSLVTLSWLSQDGSRYYGVLSLVVLLMQRIISALIFGLDEGWRTGLRQLFDIEVFWKLEDSAESYRTIYGLKKYKIIEGLFESYPELIMQTYYAMKGPHNRNMTLFYLSIVTSVLSLANCYIFSDVAAIDDGLLCLKKKSQILNDVFCSFFLWS